jgi:hypothetical protein
MPSGDSEFPINLIGPKTAQDTTYRAAIPVEERLAITMGSLTKAASAASFQNVGHTTAEAHSQRRFFQSFILSTFIALFGLCWVPEQRLNFVQSR